MKRIAIQGELGSYHDIAARQYFGDEQTEMVCCSTFEEVFAQMKADPTLIGFVAIENTIAGSLLHNYELLRDSGTAVRRAIAQAAQDAIQQQPAGHQRQRGKTERHFCARV